MCSLASSVSVVRAQPCGPSSRLGTGASQCGLTLGLGCGCHCAALGQLAASSPENQRAIAAAGGVVAVVGAMRVHPAAAGVQQKGCLGAWGFVCCLVLGLSAAGCAWGVGGGSHALSRTVCALRGLGMPVRG